MKCPEDGGEIVGMFPGGARCSNWPTCRYIVAVPSKYEATPPYKEQRPFCRTCGQDLPNG